MAETPESPNLEEPTTGVEAEDVSEGKGDISKKEIRAGTNIEGDVETRGGDFVGRDKQIFTGPVTFLTEREEAQEEDQAPAPGDPPYKGLQYFDVEDAGLFFGRDMLTAELAGRLRESRFLAVVGASGSGKSSVIRAGVIPALSKGEELADGTLPPEGSQRWKIHIITPTAHPLESLAASLTRDAESVTATSTLIDDLAADPRSLHLYARRLLPDDSDSRLLLVVDQFEELFTACRSADERKAFVDNLLTAVDEEAAGPTVVLITLRADFYPEAVHFTALRTYLESHQAIIGPMSETELRQAIERPAEAGDWELESGLTDLMLREAGSEPGALPLLSHALLETWHRRQGRKLTLAGYNDAGGVHRAIARTADRVYKNLTEDQRLIARNIFLRLTELGEGTQDTRRRASISELLSGSAQAAELEAVLQTLADRRLVITDQDTAEVAHEALIREWPLLHEWLVEDRENLRLHRQLTEAAGEWHQEGRREGWLFVGARLAQSLDLTTDSKFELNDLEKEFLAASKRLADEQKAARDSARKRELEQAQRLAATQRQRALGLLALLVVAVISGILLFSLYGQSNRNLGEAITANTQSAINLGQANAANTESVSNAATAQSASTLAVENARNAEAASTEAVQSAADAQAAREIAEEQNNLAKAQNLALQSLQLMNDRTAHLSLATLLSIESLDRYQSAEGDQALRRTLALLPAVERTLQHNNRVILASFVPGRDRLVAVLENGKLLLWETSTGRQIPHFENNTKIEAIALSPDGRLLLTGGSAGDIRVWDVDSGMEISGGGLSHDSQINDVVFSPNGRWAASASDDGIVKIWDAQSWAEPVVIEHPATVNDLEFSADDRTLATACNDHIARILEVTSGEEILALPHGDNVRKLAFDPNGKFLATASDEIYAYLWDLSSGEVAARWPHEKRVREIVFAPGGNLVATADDLDLAKVHVWDVATNLERYQFRHVGRVTRIAFNADGTLLGSSSLDQTARVWSMETGHELNRIVHESVVRDIGFNEDGSYLLTAGDDNFIKIVKTPVEQGELKYRHDKRIQDVAFSPDGAWIATAASDRTARIWNVDQAEEVFTVKHDDTVNEVAFDASSSLLATASDDGTIRIIELAGGDEIARFEHNDSVNAVEFSPSGGLLASASGDRTAAVWDIATKERRFVIEHGGSVREVAFSPQGDLLATASFDRSVQVWDIGTETRIPPLMHDSQVNSVAFNPDGTRLAAGLGAATNDGYAVVWDLASKTQVHQLQHDGRVRKVVFSPDGRWIATSGDDGIARVWDAANGSERVLTSHDGRLQDVAFSADSNWLATASDDGTARVFEVTSGKEVIRLTHPTRVVSVVFSPDGETLATGSTAGAFRIWWWQPRRLIEQACNLLTRNMTPTEWQQYIGDEEPKPSCPNLPLESEE